MAASCVCSSLSASGCALCAATSRDSCSTIWSADEADDCHSLARTASGGRHRTRLPLPSKRVASILCAFVFMYLRGSDTPP
eukprot:1328288-Prymnesium_polylepis.1